MNDQQKKELISRIDRFFSSMSDRTGYTIDDIKRILKNNNVQRISEKDISHLKHIILTHVEAKDSIIDKINANPLVPDGPCPMCELLGLDGFKIPAHGWEWKCTIGGIGHNAWYRRYQRAEDKAKVLEAYNGYQENAEVCLGTHTLQETN